MNEREWGVHWPLVLTSFVGVSLGLIGTYSMGLFMAPLEAEFGWSRAQVSSGLLIYAAVAVPLSPFVGLAIDRWGARRLAIPGTILTGLAFAAFAFADASILLWWMLWGVFGFVALAVKTTVWTTAVAAAFRRQRGLALAATLSGTGLAASIIPVLAEHLIVAFGWRTAYVAIGIGWAAVALVLAQVFFVDARRVTLAGERVDVPGYTFRQTIRLPAFRLLCLVVLLIFLLLVGLTVHLVPLLISVGIPRSAAAPLAGIFGLATMTGKLVSGFVFDRWSAKLVSAICLALPTIACGLFLQPDVGQWSAALAVFIIGFSSGSALTMASYLTARLAGLRAYGVNYSIIASLLALATGVGPLICGLVFDAERNYRLVLFAGLFVPGICSFLIARTDLSGEAP